MLLQTSAKYLWCPVISHSLLLGTLRSNNADGNENVKKKKRKKEKKKRKTLLTCFTLFCTFLCRFCTTTARKSPVSCFMEDVNKHRRNFISLSELGYQLLKIQLQADRLHSVRQSKWVGIIALKTERMQIHFSFKRHDSLLCLMGHQYQSKSIHSYSFDFTKGDWSSVIQSRGALNSAHGCPKKEKKRKPCNS